MRTKLPPYGERFGRVCSGKVVMNGGSGLARSSGLTRSSIAEVHRWPIIKTMETRV
jgi:hypothetical protein